MYRCSLSEHTKLWCMGHLAGTMDPPYITDMATGEHLEQGMARAAFIYKPTWPQAVLVSSAPLPSKHCTRHQAGSTP